MHSLLEMSVTLNPASMIEIHIPLGVILLAFFRSKRSD